MTETNKQRGYDLEDRTLEFARRVRKFLKRIPKTLSNMEDSKQLIRASGSIGANYREANESISKKDFHYRIRISRKESKESRYWLYLINTENTQELVNEQNGLIQEATELMHIFGSILKKQ